MTGNGTNITDITGMMVAGFAKAKESIMRTTTRNGTNVTDITGMMVVGIVKARESIVTMVTGRMVTGMTTTTTVIKVSPTVEAMIIKFYGIWHIENSRKPQRGHGTNQCGSRGLRNPYSQVPASALPMATIITETPLPTSANSGPGQAPASAQPRPKIVPPAA